MKKNIYIIWEFNMLTNCRWTPVMDYIDKKEALSDYNNRKRLLEYSPTCMVRFQESTVPFRYYNKYTRVFFPLGFRKWARKTEKEFWEIKEER